MKRILEFCGVLLFEASVIALFVIAYMIGNGDFTAAQSVMWVSIFTLTAICGGATVDANERKD